MSEKEAPYPVIDLHCDLPHYLATVQDADPGNIEDIGCAIPYLRQGNVKLQVMAISSVEPVPSPALTELQVKWYERLLTNYAEDFVQVTGPAESEKILGSDRIGIVSAIENAAALVANDEPVRMAFDRLEDVINRTGLPLYVSLTHHGETRFGGGNKTTVGLKGDGRALLDYLGGRKIAVDLSHTSDNLAHDIINYIDTQSLNMPVIASHSNFRDVHDHPRNLSNGLAKVIVQRQGLIGMNFLRAFMHPSDPSALAEHIAYGLNLNGGSAICFGADYFYTQAHPDPSRVPFFLEEFEHAGKYQEVLQSLVSQFDGQFLEGLSFGNVLRYLSRTC
ncbi:MAG: membrane dipeptidase [Candidatus Zixiibacteriota bacterium]|nr:MAG: membrane dipeptidase [candidate division Zixibacteria bacterium]